MASTNHALVFLKPHAVSDKAEGFVRGYLGSKNIAIDCCFDIVSEDIDKRQLIDAHYGGLAQRAMHIAPADLTISAEASAGFAAKFGGVTWESVIAAGTAMNCTGLDVADLAPNTLEKLWRAGTVMKLAGGLYVSRFPSPLDTTRDIYVVNGFYPSMRAQFTAPGDRVRVFRVSWADNGSLPWATFRNDFVGATDPAKAHPTSLRGLAFQNWAEMGLSAQPFGAENFLHASAGPVEAVHERRIWCLDAGLAASMHDSHQGTDPFLFEAVAVLRHRLQSEGTEVAAALVKVARSLLNDWVRDTQIDVHGETGGAFDMTEGMDSQAVLELLIECARAQTTASVQLSLPQCAQQQPSSCKLATAPLAPLAVANNAV